MIQLIIIVIFLFNCQKRNEIVISDNNGVIRVQNPDMPVNKDIKFLQFKEVFRLGEDTDNEHEIFHTIINLNVDKNQNLYIAEQSNNRVQQFDKSGKFLQILGGSGQGPGEYMFPASIIIGPHDEAIVLDGRAGKLIYFDSNGNYLKDDRIIDEIQKRITSPQFLDKQSILFSYNMSNRDPKSMINVKEIYLFDLVNRNLKEFLKLNMAREVITGESGAFMHRNKWSTNIAVSPQYEIYISNSMDYKIDVYHKNGQKIKEIIRNYKTIPLSQEEKESQKGGANVEGKTFSPPNYYADIQTFVFIVPNECWVISSLTENEQRIIDVFDFDGRFIQQLSVNVPINLKRSYNNLLIKFLFDESSKSLFMYQVEHNDDDIEQVVCYRAMY